MAAPGGSGGSDNITDGLRKLYTQVAALQLLPDAPQHMNFLMQLQGGIMKYIQLQARGTIGGAQAGADAASMGAGGPPPMQGNGGAMQGQMIAPGGGAGASGLAPQGPQAANDLRSLLAAQSGGG